MRLGAFHAYSPVRRRASVVIKTRTTRYTFGPFLRVVWMGP